MACVVMVDELRTQVDMMQENFADKAEIKVRVTLKGYPPALYVGMPIETRGY